MKTNYTVPTLSSLEDHGIKDLISVGNYEEELRLVQLTGIPVRIRIDKDYVELNSTENEINLSAYKECFIKLMKFFYGVGYIYGYMNGNKLTVYDIYTNDNFFSTRDLNIVEKETGLPVVKPIFEGNFTSEFIISVFNKKINEEKIPANELFILPSVYINDEREWATVKAKETSTVIYGKKPEKTYVNNYGYWDNTLKRWVTPEEQKKKEEEKTVVKNHSQYDVFQFSTKKERTEIFNETYKNVSKYVEENKSAFSNPCLEWWEKYGKYITYYYSIHTLPATRMIVWEYSELYCISYIDRYLPITEKWADFFTEFFEENYSELMKKIKFDYSFTLFFEKIFHEELLVLDKFYVQENPKSADWRYGVNNLGYLEEA